MGKMKDIDTANQEQERLGKRPKTTKNVVQFVSKRDLDLEEMDAIESAELRDRANLEWEGY